MNQRALALAESLRGQLVAIGPGVRSVSADESLSWLFVRIGAATDEILRRVADNLGLMQTRTARKGRVWWREALSRVNGVVVVAAGPHHNIEEKP